MHWSGVQSWIQSDNGGYTGKIPAIENVESCMYFDKNRKL